MSIGSFWKISYNHLFVQKKIIANYLKFYGSFKHKQKLYIQVEYASASQLLWKPTRLTFP
jgi:hypothetical protein